jgi:hypothetical protein
MRLFYSIFFTFLCACTLCAQSPAIPLHAPSYQILDRWSIKYGGRSDLHPEIKGFARKDALNFALSLDSARLNFSRLDRADIQYIINDNNEWLPDTHRLLVRNHRPPFKTFYKTPANFFEINTKHFTLRANPMLNIAAAQAQNDTALVFINQRGLEVRGELDKKVFFYTNLLETQARFPDYVRQRVDEYSSVPGAGLYKTYSPRIANLSGAYDYYIANAYFGVNVSKHVGLQIGHGTHFIGNGYRSMLLSDVGAPVFYLKLNTRVWKFHYQNIFAELSQETANVSRPTTLISKKYMAAHYLNYNVTPRFAVGLYETVVFNRSRQFELQYLNPVILYRSVEAALGSPDNVLIGLNTRWDVFRRVRLYGQVMLDEFLFSALVNPADRGWWGNKYGIQAGAKYVDAFGVSHLDLQAEWNYSRPFTYSHGDSLNSYTHYRQPLAHLLWANFKEVVCLARYQPLPRLLIRADFGENTTTENWGTNPLLGYNSRVEDFGNFTGQGVAGTLNIIGFDASWQLYHNVFLDVKFLQRRKNSADDTRDLNTRTIGLGIRMNVFSQNPDF